MANIIREIKERILRKLYWLPESQIKLVAREAKKRNLPNDSVMLRIIISSWKENISK